MAKEANSYARLLTRGIDRATTDAWLVSFQSSFAFPPHGLIRWQIEKIMVRCFEPTSLKSRCTQNLEDSHFFVCLFPASQFAIV